MKFPIISDIATKSVVYIDTSKSIAQALEKMLEYNHRNIIVKDKTDFRVLTVLNILELQKNKVDFNIALCEIELAVVPTIFRDKNVLDALEFLNEKMEYICVVNEDKSLFGLVNHTDITSNIDPDTLMDNYRLVDLIRKNSRMKWVEKNELTSLLLQEMTSESFDSIIIVDEMKPIGILTTKDVMELIKNKKDLNQPIHNYMSSPIEVINENSSIKKALEFVKQKFYKRVVVVNKEGFLSGIISQKELISLTYSRWAMLMKEYQEELSEINHMLEAKNREFESLASTDSLTGLYNRYKFSELYLSSYHSMVLRHNDMSIVLLDIDFFKVVNDTYGHNAGDLVLVQIAHTILRVLRNIDIVCRWGGEEFIALLPTASIENASLLAEKLRVNISNLEIDVVGSVNASFGVSLVREGEDMESAIDRADKALYLAKESGRNCVKSELDT